MHASWKADIRFADLGLRKPLAVEYSTMDIKQYLAQIGSKGGKSGTGTAKRRGDSRHYKRLAVLAAAGRRRAEQDRRQAKGHAERVMGYWEKGNRERASMHLVSLRQFPESYWPEQFTTWRARLGSRARRDLGL